jgi:hypothetical protein
VKGWRNRGCVKRRRELVSAEAKKCDDLDEMLSNVLKGEASSDQIEREHQQQVKMSQTYSEIWNLLVNAASWDTEECYHEFAETRVKDGWVDSQILEFVTEEEIVNCLMNMKKMVARCIIEKLKAIGIDIAL